MPSAHRAFAIGPETIDHKRGTGTATGQGVCHGNAMGMPCIIIELRGIALVVPSA